MIAMAVMLLASLAWIIYFIYRPLRDNQLDLQTSNVDLAKQRLAELEQDLAQGLIDQSVFDSAKDEVSQTLALELEQQQMLEDRAPISYPVLATVAALLVGLSIGVYQYLAPDFSPMVAKTSAPANKPVSLEESVVLLEKKVSENPKDVASYQLLGLSYFELGQMDKSLAAYDKAYQLEPNNLRLLVEYASTLVSANDNQFNSQSAGLIKKALEIDPNAPDALYLAGMFAIGLQDFQLAENLWNKALNVLEPGSGDYQIIESMLLELRQAQTQSPTAGFQVAVEIAEPIYQARANDFILIYAKSTAQPMPIAIKKMKLAAFQGQVVLGEADVLMPGSSLLEQEQITVSVRISHSGSATREADDIQVSSAPFKPQENSYVVLQVE